MLAEQSYHVAIIIPDNILDRWSSDLCKCFLLLNIVQDDCRSGREKQTSSSAVEDIVGLHRALDRLCDGIAQISDFNGLSCLIEDSEAIARDEDGCCPTASLSVGGGVSDFSRIQVSGKTDELVEPVIGWLEER